MSALATEGWEAWTVDDGLLRRFVRLHLARERRDGVEYHVGDGTWTTGDPGSVPDDEEPVVVLSTGQWQAVMEHAERELVRRRPDPGVEAVTLREALEVERARVDHALGIK